MNVWGNAAAGAPLLEYRWSLMGLRMHCVHATCRHMWPRPPQNVVRDLISTCPGGVHTCLLLARVSMQSLNRPCNCKPRLPLPVLPTFMGPLQREQILSLLETTPPSNATGHTTAPPFFRFIFQTLYSSRLFQDATVSICLLQRASKYSTGWKLVCRRPRCFSGCTLFSCPTTQFS